MSVLIQEKKPEVKVEVLPEITPFGKSVEKLKIHNPSDTFRYRLSATNVRSTMNHRFANLAGAVVGCIVPPAGGPDVVLSLEGLSANRTFTFPTITIHHERKHVGSPFGNYDTIIAPDAPVMWAGTRLYRDSDQIVQNASIDSILDKIHAIKTKGKNKWITFEDVVPYWGGMINKMFKQGRVGKQNPSKNLNNLSNSTRCVMGEADDNPSYKKHNNNWGQCGGCTYLATTGLHLFSNYGIRDRVSGNELRTYLTSEDGWNEYKSRFEYHWNIFHR